MLWPRRTFAEGMDWNLWLGPSMRSVLPCWFRQPFPGVFQSVDVMLYDGVHDLNYPFGLAIGL